MKKLLTLALFTFIVVAMLLVTMCKKTDEPCTPPTTPVPTANTPEIYDTLYLHVDTVGMTGLEFYWSGPDSFHSRAIWPVIPNVIPIKAGTYKLYVRNPITLCSSLEGTVVVSIKQPAPCPGTETVVYGSKTYNTVQIASQCWLKENLDIGDQVMSVTSSDMHSNQSNNGLIEKYCYDNDAVKCNNYGGLYDWNEIMQYSAVEGTKGICPTGWHIPSRVDWQTLLTGIKDGSKLSGIKMKEGGSVGFEALLAGFRYPTGTCYSIGDYTDYWSSTQDGTLAWHLRIRLADVTAMLDRSDKRFGFSVRCLKD